MDTPEATSLPVCQESALSGTKMADFGTSGFDIDPERISGWVPSVNTADAEIFKSRRKTTGRARDVFTTNPWARNGCVRSRDSVVGITLTLNYRPNWRSLGIEPDTEFRRKVEAEWKDYAYGQMRFMDASRSLNFGQLIRVCYNHHWRDGSAIVLPLWQPNRGGAATSFFLVDPDRLQTPVNVSNVKRIKNGVEIDKYDAPVAYHFRKSHPSEIMFNGEHRPHEFVRVPAFGPLGRKRVIHYFEKEFADQSIGKSRLTAVLEKLKLVEEWDSRYIQMAILETIMGIFIKSPFDGEFLMDALDPNNSGIKIDGYQKLRKAFHDMAGLKLNGVSMNHLFAGEDIETVKSERPSGDYGPFVAAQMRGVAAGTGNSYEQLSMDYSQSNYSSIRAVMNEVWRSILVERDNLAFSLATPMFALWFEEMVNQNPDWLPAGAPGFYVNRDAYLHARWIGPGRGHVDPDKESRGQGRRLENGVETVMAQYAADGRDPEEAREELLEEVEFYNSKGWVHPSQAEQMNNPGQPVTQETEFPENEQEDEDQ